MATMITCTEGRYKVQKTSYGEAYVWRPGCVVVECDCGERPTLTASLTACGCGTDHEGLVRDELASKRSPSEEALHPWEDEYLEWRDEFLRSESHDWLEWKVIQ